MNNIRNNLSLILSNIESTKKKYDINHNVLLLAVSKKKPAQDIKTAYNSGQQHFGESYISEALEKQKTLSNLAITWHFIGPIQSNKTKKIAENFTWVHSIASLKVAKRLSDQRPSHLTPINICLQINIDNEITKSGFSPNLPIILDVIRPIISLPNIRLRGLMCIPSPQDSKQTIKSFNEVKAIKQEINHYLETHHPGTTLMDTLSMGMSGDIEEAIQCSSTIIRVGSAIFGERS